MKSDNKSPHEWAIHLKGVFGSSGGVSARDIEAIQQEAIQQFKAACLNPNNVARAERIRSAMRGIT